MLRIQSRIGNSANENVRPAVNRRNGALLCVASFVIAPASTANAQDCSIVFGRGGARVTFSSPVNRDVANVQGPWEFIASTRGPCTFEVFNAAGLTGPSVVYGTNISKRIRIGARGAQNHDGWRARSLRIRRANRTECRLVLRDLDIEQTFFGPVARLSEVSGWPVVRATSGPGCRFEVFEKTGLTGKNVVYGTNISGGVHAGATGGQTTGGWPVRSFRIQHAGGSTCAVSLGDNGRSQTFTGPGEIRNISGWNFVRGSSGGCRISVFNESDLGGKQETFDEDVRGTAIRVGWRIRSLVIRARSNSLSD